MDLRDRLMNSVYLAAEDGGAGGGGQAGADNDGGDGGGDDLAAMKAQLDAQKAAVLKLEKKNKDLVTYNQTLQDKVRPWADFDAEQADTLKQLLAEHEKRDTDKLKDKGDIDALLEKARKRVLDEYAPKLEEATKAAQALAAENSALRQAKAFDDVARTLAIDPDLRDLFDAHMGKLVKWHRESDDDPEQLVVEVEGGNVMDFGRWAREIWVGSAMAKKLMLAEALPGGSGSHGSAVNGRGSVATPDRVSKMSQADYEKWRAGQAR